MAVRGDLIRHSTTLVVETCGNCQITFGIPDTLYQAALRDRSVKFWCPNGHLVGYLGPDKAARLQQQLDRERAARTRAEARNDQLRAEVKHQEARVKGYQGQLAKTKKRIGKGVCPCCNRHFANVERHMASQHPEMVAG